MTNPSLNRTRLVHIDQAASILNLSVSNMYRLAREHKIPAVRIGKRWLFDVDQIIQSVSGRRTAQAVRKQSRTSPVPDVTAPNPDQIIMHAREVLHEAAMAVKRAAEVMQLIEQARSAQGSAGSA